MNDWNLAQQTHAVIRKQRWEVAVLPFGATEPHNLHMPYGADTYQVDAIGQRVCERANQNGARVILLPTIPYGVNTNFLRIPGGLTCSLNPTTLYRIITDLVDSMERQGVRKLVLLNGHGGNELKPILRELHDARRSFCACAIGIAWPSTSIRGCSSNPANTPTRWKPAWAWPTFPIW